MLSFKFEGFPENIIVRRLIQNISMILWQYEDCPDSKEIRTILSRDSIDVISMNIDKNDKKKWDLFENYTGKRQVPHITDFAYNRNINGVEAIKQYLKTQYNVKF